MQQSSGFKYGRMPKSVGCYICGKQYGTASILIHLKSCQKKWEIQESHKPKKMRRACPMPPPGFLERLGKKKVKQSDLDEINAMAFYNYNEQALLKCQHCERSFNPQSYQIHKKMCFADKPFKPLNKSVTRKPQTNNENSSYNTKQSRYKTPGRQKEFDSKSQNIDTYQSKKNYQSRSQVPQQQNVQNKNFSDISKKEIFDKKKYQRRQTPVYISEGTQTLESTLQNKTVTNVDKYQQERKTRDSSIGYQKNKQIQNDRDQYTNLRKDKYDSKPQKTSQQLKNEAALESFIASHFTKKSQKSKKSKPKNQYKKEYNKPKKSYQQEYKEPSYNQDYYEQPVLLGMERCKKCKRTFANDRIDKHQSVCLGNSKPKKVRRFHKPPPKKQIAREKAKLKSKWRDQHKEFQANIQYMRKLKKAEDQGIALVNIPPPPPSQNSHLTPCKHCGRKFNSKAHARHEPICQSIINKPKPLRRKRY